MLPLKFSLKGFDLCTMCLCDNCLLKIFQAKNFKIYFFGFIQFALSLFTEFRRKKYFIVNVKVYFKSLKALHNLNL